MSDKRQIFIFGYKSLCYRRKLIIGGNITYSHACLHNKKKVYNRKWTSDYQMDDISVKINDDSNKIEIDVDKIDVDKNDVDKIFTFDDERHNGKPITKIEISPNDKYLITYSEKDLSIVGWNVEDMDKFQLKFDQTVKIIENIDYITGLCVSDDKKVAYACHREYRYGLNIIDMNSEDKKIALSSNREVDPRERKIIWIYSTQTKYNKWECKRFYEIPYNYYEIISISKYDNVYLFSNDCIYEWNINTEKSIKIFVNNKDKNKFETCLIRIFSNEKFNILKANDKIIVYSIELGIPIASLDINDDMTIAITKNIWKYFNITKEYFQNLLYHYQIMKVLD
ncbi:hypothetical protein RhiirB3_395238 [Rhizophagus irregularis]|nr:hypothetical protein RhiirB3_395238 [Rhizophagus irregularis]